MNMVLLKTEWDLIKSTDLEITKLTKRKAASPGGEGEIRVYSGVGLRNSITLSDVSHVPFKGRQLCPLFQFK